MVPQWMAATPAMPMARCVSRYPRNRDFTMSCRMPQTGCCREVEEYAQDPASRVDNRRNVSFMAASTSLSLARRAVDGFRQPLRRGTRPLASGSR